ncbi:solute carrier family 2, facilitated glucose transporter member 5-like [Sorex fumeus]|uniref:solute carrier family 2, facilitated glucose transporter member 5-like n=1 Tax=Sorex fumeus TaxID=62283 RepID=UPI0024AD5F29|nr:solute carrier family 2, facilitated glucose transporter member 5-like [Sorex fumeus]
MEGQELVPEQGPEQDPGQRKGRLTRVLLATTLVATFGSSFQYGYNVAVINSPEKYMKNFYNETHHGRTGQYLSESLLTLLWSLSVSVFPLGGLLGSFLVGPSVNRFGRKGTLLLNNVFSIGPAFCMGLSRLARSYEMIIVGRIFVGICAGISSNVVPMYLGELAPRNLRGALGVMPQLFITIGILIAQILGITFILGNDQGWTTLLGLTAIPAAVQVLVLPFLPESPRYLLIQKKDTSAARKALQRLRGWEHVEDELEEIRQEDEAQKAAGTVSVWKLFLTRSLRWQLVSTICLMGGQQLSGVNAIYYYANEIYTNTGIEPSQVQYVTVGTGAINVVATLVSVFVVELLGRRVLLLLGFLLCGGACCVLTAGLVLQDTVSWMSYLSITCIFSYVVGHALGPSPIPPLIITEAFLQSSRASAFMVGGTVHWLSNFTVGLVFPFIQRSLGAYSFIIFASVCFLTAVYILLVLPETKGKTFVEISQMFAKKTPSADDVQGKGELRDLPPAPVAAS